MISHLIAISCANAIFLYIVRNEGGFLTPLANRVINGLRNSLLTKIYECLTCSSWWTSATSVFFYWIANDDASAFLYIPLMTVLTIYASKIIE